MKVIIAGSREGITEDDVTNAIWSSKFPIDEIISGGAIGADKLGEIWAMAYDIPLHIFPADWKTFGKRAGFLRNQEMAKYADALIAVWNGKSKGTAHMIKSMEALNKPVFVFMCKNE
jgi:hypothetical protein